MPEPFVILRHECPPNFGRPLHWDFFYREGDVLRAWALAELPTLDRSVSAERLADHRLAYLDYEGPVSRDRGHVTRWDVGKCELLEELTDRLVIAVDGERIRGRLTLSQDGAGQWCCRVEE